MNPSKILIAGVGNELRQDDAFGIEFVKRWDQTVSTPSHIKSMEVGIGVSILYKNCIVSMIF